MNLAVVGAIVALVVAIIGIIVQILTAGVYIGKLEGFKQLVNFRFDEQQKKPDAHNNFIVRVYELERRDGIKEEQLKVTNNRLKDLETIVK